MFLKIQHALNHLFETNTFYFYDDPEEYVFKNAITEDFNISYVYLRVIMGIFDNYFCTKFRMKTWNISNKASALSDYPPLTQCQFNATRVSLNVVSSDDIFAS